MIEISNLVKTIAVSYRYLVFNSSGRNEWSGLITPRLSKQVRNGVILGISGLDTTPFSDPVSKRGERILFERTSAAMG
jgi:hypothetical protein